MVAGFGGDDVGDGAAGVVAARGSEVDLVLAMLRARQLWGGERNVPGLREALGLDESGTEVRGRVDVVESQARGLVSALQAADWSADAVDRFVDEVRRHTPRDSGRFPVHGAMR